MADVKFEDNTIKVTNAIEQACIKFLHGAAGELESQAIRNTRRDKSQLAGQWGYKINKAKLEAVVGNPLENAIWEEFGTGEYALKGNGRKTPWYVPVDGYLGKKKPTYNGKVIVVYGKNKKKYYKTNGKRGTRAFEKAKNTVQPKIEKYAEQAFGGLNS